MSLQRSSLPSSKPAKPKRSRWFDRLIAAIGVLNLGLVAFDLSYIPWRDLYLKDAPGLTHWYGERFKGIEPHRMTEGYLNTVSQLEEVVARSGLNSTEAGVLLAELRTQSTQMIEDNPFQVANKSGTLERVKNRMRDRMAVESSRAAFNRFWSQAYLEQVGWEQSIGFFNRQIRPLVETNYYRNIGENGEPIDRFWQLDLWFIAIFAADYLGRTFLLSRRYRGVTWLDTLIWRWYDLFLILPFWRWLRVIPVTIRLNQSQLLDLEPIRTRITHGFISSFAIEITEIVVIRIIDQMQGLVRQGNIARWLLSSTPQTRYVDLNGVDEVEALSKQFLTLAVDKVLPKVQPDIEALILHSVNSALQQNPVYQGFQRLPGVGNLPHQLAEQLVSSITQNVYGAISASLDDPVAAELSDRFLKNLTNSLKAEIRQEKTVQEIEALVVALLDEVKVNYVERLADQDFDQRREQTHQLYGMTQRNKPKAGITSRGRMR